MLIWIKVVSITFKIFRNTRGCSQIIIMLQIRFISFNKFILNTVCICKALLDLWYQSKKKPLVWLRTTLLVTVYNIPRIEPWGSEVFRYWGGKDDATNETKKKQ